MADANFGRPQDKDIQRQFMKKIRGDKLQAINAECQLQICLAFKEDQKQAKKNGRSKKQPSKVEQSQAEGNGPQSILIPGLAIDRREKLTEYFDEFKDKWEFQQIKEGEPLPEYFFDDGCDLSYILHEISTREKSQEMFKAGELIFLELLCLWGRKLFNEKIKEYYQNQETMNFMSELMETGLEKIRNKLKDGHQEQKGVESHMQEENQEESNMNNESQVEQASSEKKGKKKAQPPKTKKIGKDKNSSKAKKNKKKGASEQSEQQIQNKESDIPEERQLAVKTINYICWAYWYIIKKGQ